MSRKLTRGVNVYQFQKFINNADYALVDVRSEQEYIGGHIPGSIHADMYDSSFGDIIVSQIPKDKKILVYCYSGARSARSMKSIEKLGYSEVINLSGGIRAWSSAGKPVERGSKRIERTDL
ncbi:thioredoxin [Aduncisulcus paluster]|uniref:Thioredoxin n=1 Tax=Aduncisulcus paluster TaxID=2918883 RepID=A0ABQ5KBF4_9EUKA|nr:thioredoxin [Aduncisulcus paluster]